MLNFVQNDQKSSKSEKIDVFVHNLTRYSAFDAVRSIVILLKNIKFVIDKMCATDVQFRLIFILYFQPIHDRFL